MKTLVIRPRSFAVKSLKVDSLENIGGEFNSTDKPVSMKISSEQIDKVNVAIIITARLMLDDGMAMEVAYSVVFEVADSADKNFELDAEILKDQFFTVNAPAIAYPFLRAFIATFCVNAGYPVKMLPAVNFQAMHNDRKKQELSVLAKSAKDHAPN